MASKELVGASGIPDPDVGYVVDGTEYAHFVDRNGNSRRIRLIDIAALAASASATAEFIRDTTAAALVQSGLVTIVNNDGADTITFSIDTEALQDAIAAFLTATSPIVETYDDAGNSEGFSLDRTALKPTESFKVACSDETTALTAGVGKVTFRMPYAFTVTAVRAELVTAQASGAIFTVDINEAGVSILSTKLTIDNTEKTSTTAVTAPVISDTSLADDAEMSVDIDQIGDGTAKGLKVTLIGYRT
jgi:hypothetical protein